MRKHAIKDLIEQEKLLYLEVEQLRYRLYLHDSSLLFEFFSAFYFAYQDIKKLFVKQRGEKSSYETKKQSITSLLKKRHALTLLSNTPYAWIIFLARRIKYSLPSLRASISSLRVSLSSRAATRDLYNSSLSSRTKLRDLNKTFLIFGTTSGDDLQSRSVQIAQKLSEKNKVIYIEGVFDEGSTPGFRIIEDINNRVVIRLTARKSLHLNYQKPSSSEIIFLKKSFKLFNLKTLKTRNFQTYIHHPFWSFILPIKKDTYLFDHSDNFSQHKNAATHIILAEKKVLKNASFVTAPDIKLLRNKKDIIVKNGVDWELFKDTSKMIQTCDVGLCWIKKPVMGYIGTLDEKIDEELLAKLASAFPSTSIVLVGNTDYRPIIEVAEKFQNIFPVGKQPYKKLPLFLQSFDILIAPYKSQGQSIHPELPLYLASGKPILHTSSGVQGQKQPYKACLYLPKTHTEWTLAVAEALKEKKRSKKKYLRIAAAKKLKWNTSQLS